ncbi:MAG: TIM-barrel domain-containing protein, partial [Myxococcota bacterium]
VPVRCDEEGSFHGFGEQYNATEQPGEAFTLMVTEQGIGREGNVRALEGDAHTTYFPMPYYLDVRGHGTLFSTDHRVDVDVCKTDPEAAWFEAVAGEPLEWVVFHGPTPSDVIRQLGEVVGRPRQPPDWAWDLWISKQGGEGEVLDEAAKLQANDVPAGVLWSQDWSGLRMNAGGGFGVEYRWAADETLYPDLAALTTQLEDDYGMRFLGYANPFVDANLTDFFPAMRDMGLLIENEAGEAYVFTAPNGESSHPDFTDPAARDFVQQALVDMVEVHGMDGWMSDFGEWNPLDAVMDSGVDPRAYHNRYPVEWHAVVRDALEEARPGGDYVTFARSGWTGVQGVAMIHWVGDQEANWSETDGLPTVVPALINLGLAGQPYVTHDIAGFSGGPSTKELYQRWTELGAFTPIMRTHEGNQRDENWNWNGGPEGDDAETIAHFGRFARVHEALGPELVALATEAATTGLPMVRHLMLEFPDDPDTYRVDDQYMLGDALLVAPVVTEGAVSRDVYLPPGTWYHVWTGDRHEGGQTVTVDAPIGSPPVFSRGDDRPDLRAIE